MNNERNKFGHAKRKIRPAAPLYAHRCSFWRRICMCVCVIVYLCPFRCRSSRHGYHVNFGGTFVYVHVYKCVILSFLLLRGIGRRYVCVCMHAHEFMCVCACVRRCVFCYRSSSGFRCIDFIRTRGCTCVCMCVYKKGPGMFFHSF